MDVGAPTHFHVFDYEISLKQNIRLIELKWLKMNESLRVGLTGSRRLRDIENFVSQFGVARKQIKS